MRAWRGPSIRPPWSPETLRAGTPCRGPPFVGTDIRERLVLPLAREAPDGEETPTGGLLFPGGEEIFSARAQYEHHARHLPADAESAARLIPPSQAAPRWKNRKASACRSRSPLIWPA